jgi:hypothetical protein
MRGPRLARCCRALCCAEDSAVVFGLGQRAKRRNLALASRACHFEIKSPDLSCPATVLLVAGPDGIRSY